VKYDPTLASYGEFDLSFCNHFGLLATKPEEGFIGKSLDFTLMSGSTTVEVRSQGHPSLEGERRPKK
jgi:hypothetical protein